MVDALLIVSSKYYHLLLTTYYLLGMALPMVNALPMALPMAESMPIVTAQFSPAGGVQSCMGDGRRHAHCLYPCGDACRGGSADLKWGNVTNKQRRKLIDEKRC